jgi:NadR type nicotinamide-nucleotide adenylyltransferase
MAQRRWRAARLRRVALIGAESTGKTTLAARLAERYDTAWSREYARDYCAAKGAELEPADLVAVARGQARLEDRAAARARRLLILDTDLLSTVVYSRHYFGSCPEPVEAQARRRRADLYLLLGPDVPWVADPPQRVQPQRRLELHAALRAQLDAWGARWVEIAGPWPRRARQARHAIDRLLAAPGPGLSRAARPTRRIAARPARRG